MTQALQTDVVQEMIATIPYAIPVGPYRLMTAQEVEFCETVDGVYATLSLAEFEPGVRVSGGFIKRSGSGTFAVLKKISVLSDAYPGYVSRSEPLAFYRLGEQTGSNFYNSVNGQLYTLTIAGGVTLAEAGPLGDGSLAAAFNGTTGVAGTANSIDTWANEEALSFEAWVYNPTWGGGHEMVICLGAQGLYMSVVNARLLMSIKLNVGGQFTNRQVDQITSAAWHHIAVTWESGDQIRLYVDGYEVEGDTTNVRTGTLVSSAELYLAAFGGSALFFSGTIAQPAVYLRKLTAAEVLQHWGSRNNQ